MSERKATYRAVPAGKRAKPAADRTTNHNAICSAIRDYLELQGGWVMKVLGGIGQKPGVSDLLSALPDPPGPARFVAVEVKTGKAVLNTAQVAFRDEMARVGALYVEAHDVADVVTAVEAAGLARTRTLQLG